MGEKKLQARVGGIISKRARKLTTPLQI